jgi:hypothetical protein
MLPGGWDFGGFKQVCGWQRQRTVPVSWFYADSTWCAAAGTGQAKRSSASASGGFAVFITLDAGRRVGMRNATSTISRVYL